MKPLFFAISAALLVGASAKPPITEGEKSPVMLDLDPYLISALYGSGDDGKGGRFGSEGGLPDLMKEEAFRELIKKHDLKLFNGPLLGDVTPASVKFWLRTAGPAKVQIKVGDITSSVVETNAAGDFTGVMTVDGLNPFQEYDYSVILDGTEIKNENYRFKTAPEPGEAEKFHISFGACSRYVPEHEHAWANLAARRPLAYLGLGDNVYIDVIGRRDAQRLFYYRRYLSPAYASLVASVPMYAVWDDHDMGMNDSAGGPGLKLPWKLPNWTVFHQNWNNPAYGGGDKLPGTWHSFQIGEVEVFMTDGRFYRDKKSKTMLGPDQKKWLLEGLKNSTATFKIIGSGTMFSDGADKGGADSWAGKWARGEREEIFSLINQEKIDGVLLIAGDRHRSDIWKTDRTEQGGYPLYEFVSGKVTNIHTHKTFKNAIWSYNKGNFWGEFHFDFGVEDPTVEFKCVDSSGEIIKSFPLKLSDLSHPK